LGAWLLAALPITNASQVSNDNRTTVIIVVGAPGEAEFGTNFVRQASIWEKTCQQANCRRITLGLDASQTNDFETLKQTFESEPKDGPSDLWLVLIGHGTFDGKEARFNLRGPDLSATELALWLQPLHRRMAIINTASSSAPFINKLSRTNRVIITATRSGNEQNFARFGQYFCEAITNPEADLDKDEQVSLLEAFLMASRQAGEFYKVEAGSLPNTPCSMTTAMAWHAGGVVSRAPGDQETQRQRSRGRSAGSAISPAQQPDRSKAFTGSARPPRCAGTRCRSSSGERRNSCRRMNTTSDSKGFCSNSGVFTSPTQSCPLFRQPPSDRDLGMTEL
jgi:hypothetical protein